MGKDQGESAAEERVEEGADGIEEEEKASELGIAKKDEYWARVHIWQIAAVRDVFWIGLVLFVIWFGYQLSSIFTPVLVGLALAYIFHPMITACEEKWGMKRPLTVSIILGVMVLVVVSVMGLFGPRFVDQVVEFAKDVPKYIQNLNENEAIKDFAERNDIDLHEVQAGMQDWVKNIQENPVEFFRDKVGFLLAGAGKAGRWVLDLMGTMTYIALTMVLIPIYFFYFAWQFGPLFRNVDGMVPKSKRGETMRVLKLMDEAVSKFFRDRLLIALIMFVMYAVGWSLCGVPYWLILAFFAGLLSLIPYMSGVVWPVVVGLMYLKATSGADATGFAFWYVVGWPSLVFFLVQFVEGWILTPWIQGKSMEMSAVTILIVMFVGGSVGGMYGLILCLPAMACFKILWREVLFPRFQAWCAAN